MTPEATFAGQPIRSFDLIDNFGLPKCYLFTRMLRALSGAGYRRLAYRLVTFSSRSQSTGNQLGKVEPDDVKEEEISLSKFQTTELMPEMPIKGLNILKGIEKVKKKGSFTVDIFKGSFDEEALIYPDSLDNREENQQLKEQAAMVRQLFPQIWDDERQLQHFNFFDLFQLSVTEMMVIFESIGASTRGCANAAPTTYDVQLHTLNHQTRVSRAVISLIIRNCLTFWPMSKSENPKIKELLPARSILFGGSSEESRLLKPLGFCWTEQAPEFGSLPPQEWSTLALHAGPPSNECLIKGRKTRVLNEDNVEKYLVYYRDKPLADRYMEKPVASEANPASDPFVGCCLINKSQLNLSQPYFDSAGIRYVDIDIDAVVHPDEVVFPAERKGTIGINTKGLGQLAASTVILGILKDSLKMTYQHLLSQKRGLLDCDIIERKLVGVTSKIFAIESMVYYIAGMYDGLEDGFDAHMETTILKIVTNEYAYQALKDLQDVCSSDMFVISKLQDQINIFDSFLDGNIYNRIYLATMGVLWFARSKNIELNKLRLAPWYPGYFIKHYIRERAQRGDLLTVDADFHGHLHPSLKEAADNLAYIVKRVKYASETLCMRYGKDVTGAQSALYQLSQLSIDSFMLTAMCARASKSYCNGSRNAEIDVLLTTSFALDLSREVHLYIDSIERVGVNALHSKATVINELNIKNAGYYAESPLDPNI